MVIMDSYYTQEHLREVWQKIDQLHLGYLEMEESQDKIAHRNRLEDCIEEFLCIATHSQKFYFPETAEILQRSAASKKDFSGYKAATGFNAIQQYAGNLLFQPWRKEYRQIKTYCGFYVHQVKANLVGAERMFEAMGYKHAGDGLLVLDGPICPDRVANVSKDCLVAHGECQILKAIWEEVSNLNITWLDTLDFRKTHVCSAEQCARALKYRQQSRHMHQEHARSFSQGSDPFIIDTKFTNQNNHMFPMNNSFPPLSAHNPTHNHVALAPTTVVPQYYYGNGCCANSMQPTYAQGLTGCLPYPQPVAKPVFNTNGYFYTNGYVPSVPAVPYGYPGIPTGQLIDVDAYNGYDAVDSGGPSHSRVRRISRQEGSTRGSDVAKPRISDTHNPVTDGADSRDGAQYEENWDYVYRNLESKGYRKDVGDRGNILSTETDPKHRHSRESKKYKPTNLDEAMNNLSLSDTRPLKMTEALERIERKPIEPKPEENRHSAGSSYENLSPNESAKPKQTTNSATNTGTLNSTKSKLHTKDAQKTPKSDTHKAPETRKQKEKDTKPPTWQCKACTFLNETSSNVCQMCSKSRVINDETPIEVGGAECAKCTLVNSKNLKVCQACGASLKNSPTYI